MVEVNNKFLVNSLCSANEQKRVEANKNDKEAPKKVSRLDVFIDAGKLVSDD